MLLRAGAEREAVDDGRMPVSPRFCTVLVGAVHPTPRGVDIILCSGGHPLPLVRRAVGRVEPVGVPGTSAPISTSWEIRSKLSWSSTSMWEKSLAIRSWPSSNTICSARSTRSETYPGRSWPSRVIS